MNTDCHRGVLWEGMGHILGNECVFSFSLKSGDLSVCADACVRMCISSWCGNKGRKTGIMFTAFGQRQGKKKKKLHK